MSGFFVFFIFPRGLHEMENSYCKNLNHWTTPLLLLLLCRIFGCIYVFMSYNNWRIMAMAAGANMKWEFFSYYQHTHTKKPNTDIGFPWLLLECNFFASQSHTHTQNHSKQVVWKAEHHFLLRWWWWFGMKENCALLYLYFSVIFSIEISMW